MSRIRHSEMPMDARLNDNGMLTDGDRIYTQGAEMLAVFIRHGEKPLVRLTLPSAETVLRYRAIRDAVVGGGGQVVAIPANVLEAAEIHPHTIEVIHTRRSKHPFRADEQVIKASVRTPVWGRDNWSLTRARITGYGEREAYFLSGYDSNEKGMSYFLCELPPGAEPVSVRQAYESLKPEAVKEAERAGVKVKRQGDMFFIQMKNWKPPSTDVYPKTYVHATNHRAEYTTYSGPRSATRLTYVKGTITHAPVGRDADHAPLKLGDKHWWLCVKNTVPVVGQLAPTPDEQVALGAISPRMGEFGTF